MSLFTAILWFFNFLLCITFPSFVHSFHNVGTFCYYAAWCVIGWFCVLFFVPETGGQTLEALDARFSIPTRHLMKFGLQQVKYAFGHGVLRRRMRKPRLDPADVPNALPEKALRNMSTRGSDDISGPRQIPLDTDIERLAIVTSHDY